MFAFRKFFAFKLSKEDLIQHLPSIFLDPISFQPLDPSHLSVSPYGHCYNHDTLIDVWNLQLEQKGAKTTCPLSTLPLDVTLLASGNLVEKLREILTEIHDNIENYCSASYKSQTEKEAKLAEFKRFIAGNENEFISTLDQIKKITLIKTNSKLNIKSMEDWQYWDSRGGFTKAILSLFGSKKLFELANFESSLAADGKSYHYIPKEIANLMRIADSKFDSDNTFVDKLNRQIEKEKAKKSCFFRCVYSRPAIKILTTDDICKIDLRKKI